MFAENRKVKLLTLGAMCFSLFMVMLDNTVVNLALPTLQRELSADISELQWIIDAFTLLVASLMLTGGTLGDLYGRKRVFMSGLAVFTAGSLLCALAPTVFVLIGGRVVQGLGAAVMMPSTLAIITNTFLDPRERAQAIGLWAGVSGIALALGPAVGGVMVDALGWQSIFFLNLPIGVIAVAMAWRVVPESSAPAGRSLDLPGQALAVIALASLTYALIEANNHGWTSAFILGLFGLAAVTLVAFVVVEMRNPSPMLQLTFFRNLTFTGANTVGLLISFGFFGILFFLALFLQNVQGYSATEAGLLQLPCTLAVMVSAIASGRIVGAIGARVPITLGMLVLAAGLLLMVAVDATTPYSGFWWILVIQGIGNGLVMSPITTAVMSTIPPARAGMAAATSNTMRQVGGVFGIALLGSIVTHRFTGSLTATLADMNLPPAVQQTILAMANQGQQGASGRVPRGFDPAMLERVVDESFVEALHLGLWVCGGVLLLGALVGFLTVHNTSPAAQRRAAGGSPVAASAGPAEGS